jgi:hypothetical protein
MSKMQKITGRFLLAGIVAALACSIGSILSLVGCNAPGKASSKDADAIKLAIAARCVDTLADSVNFGLPPEVCVFDSAKSHRLIAVPDWFIDEVGRKGIRVARTPEHPDLGVGAAVISIDLANISGSRDQKTTVEIFEYWNFSRKFLHDFGVSVKDGKIQEVVLLRSSEI